MTARFVGLCALALGLIVFGAWALSGPQVQAAETECVTIGDAVAGLEGLDGEMIDLIDVPGETVDQLLFGSVGGKVKMWGAKNGCMVGVPIAVDAVKAEIPA